jgi:phospholipid/cholesterol/gamma-HCH transport system substrate-binding protein
VPASGDRWYRVGVTSTPDGVTRRSVWEVVDEDGNSIGTRDVTETRHAIAIDAELARSFGPITLRGGVLESTAGFGVDVQAFNWMSVSGEMFRFTGDGPPNLRSALTFYPFFNPDSNMPWNWIYLRAGISNALHGDRDFFLGGGLRFADREIRGLVGLVPLFN